MEKTTIEVNPENWCDDKVSVEVRKYADGKVRLNFWDQHFMISAVRMDNVLRIHRCALFDEDKRRVATIWEEGNGWLALESDQDPGISRTGKTPEEAAIKIISNLY